MTFGARPPRLFASGTFAFILMSALVPGGEGPQCVPVTPFSTWWGRDLILMTTIRYRVVWPLGTNGS
jgi:hypothetical protein